MKTNNYYTKSMNQCHFLMPINLMSQKVKFIIAKIKSSVYLLLVTANRNFGKKSQHLCSLLLTSKKSKLGQSRSNICSLLLTANRALTRFAFLRY